MASFKFNAKTGRTRLFFRFNGQQFNRTIMVASAREAERACALVEETIQDLKRGKLSLAPDADPAEFLLSGGKVVSIPKCDDVASRKASRPLRLREVFDIYSENLTPGSKEQNSLGTEAVHRRHFIRLMAETLDLESLGIDRIQKYVDTRAREGVGRETIRKELSTLRVIWGWAYKRKHVGTSADWKMVDLTFPKADEKTPFQTWGQIARKIDRDKLDAEHQAKLWECVWLNQQETLECLDWVRENATHSFLYPMFAFAAYTGSRRDEIIRSERDDWDLESGLVTIRQKKADKSKTFTRRDVAVHPALAQVMRRWFQGHPGGSWTICTSDGAPIGVKMATKNFRRTVEGGKWSVLRGWHTFRHSLASNMASSGTDQRVINEILGHHTEEMERRYRHLLPQKQVQALQGLFQSV